MEKPTPTPLASLPQPMLDLYSGGKVPQDAQEALKAFEILSRVYPDIEPHVRRVLVRRLAAHSSVPHDLVWMMANDQIDIARPMIIHSPVLLDEDLVRLIVEWGDGHALAVAQRAEVSPSVSEALVSLGDEDISLTLLNNRGAELGEQAMRQLALFSRNAPRLQDPLLRHPAMSIELASLMYHWVGAALQAYIIETYDDVIGDKLRDEVVWATRDALAEHLGSQPSHTPFPPENGGTEEIDSRAAAVLAALRSRDLKVAENAMARLTRLSVEYAARILYHDNGEALAVVARSAGLPRPVFSELFVLVHGLPPYEVFAQSPAHEKALHYFSALTPQQADVILDGWRSNPTTVWGNLNYETPILELRRRRRE